MAGPSFRAESTAPAGNERRVINLSDNVVREAEFDPAHVRHELLILGDPHEGTRSGTFDLFIPKDEAGKIDLNMAGYRRIEVVVNNNQVQEGYLHPLDHSRYVNLTESQCHTCHPASPSLPRFMESHQGEGQLRSAKAAIGIATVSAPPWNLSCNNNIVEDFTPGDESRPPLTFSAKVIDPKAPPEVQKDARSLLREEGLVPRAIPGDNREFWLSPLQWGCYQHAGGKIRFREVDLLHE